MISAILGLSAVVLTASGAVKAMVFLLAMGAAAIVAWRVFLVTPGHEKQEAPAEAEKPEAKKKEDNDHG